MNKRKAEASVGDSKSEKIKKPKHESAETVKKHASAEDFDTRFHEFFKRIKAHVQQYVAKHDTMKCLLDLEFAKKKEYMRVFYKDRQLATLTRYYAAVDLKNGDVFATPAANVNRNSHRNKNFPSASFSMVYVAKGNIFDESYGCGMLNPDSYEFKHKVPEKRERKADVSKDWTAIDDPTPYLGHIFTGPPDFCYVAPTFYRIVGWTKSKKSVIIQDVPRTGQARDYSCQLDVKWIEANPCKESRIEKHADLALLRASTNKPDEPYLVTGGHMYCFVHPRDYAHVYTWCEY